MPAKVRFTLLGLILLAALALTPFRPLKVEGNSMHPTLLNGETYVLDQVYWKPSGLRRGDIVVVKHGQQKWVKRLVGMPGDRLQIQRRRDGWVVHVGNLTLNPAARRSEGFLEEITVPDSEIFVIGDNLNWSADSTSERSGSFRLEHVLGVVRTFGMRRDFPFRQHL